MLLNKIKKTGFAPWVVGYSSLFEQDHGNGCVEFEKKKR